MPHLPMLGVFWGPFVQCLEPFPSPLSKAWNFRLHPSNATFSNSQPCNPRVKSYPATTKHRGVNAKNQFHMQRYRRYRCRAWTSPEENPGSLRSSSLLQARIFYILIPFFKTYRYKNILHLSLHSARCGPHRGGPSEAPIRTYLG